MGTTCFWCWRCLAAVDPYRTWAGDTHRCPGCHARVLEISLGTLRFFSFLGDAATPEERLRRARQPHGRGGGGGSEDGWQRQGAYRAEAGPSGWRSRHAWRFTWDTDGERERERERVVSHDRPMTRREALDLLGLDDLATEVQVRAAYRRLAKRHHPDVQATPELRGRAQQRMARLNAAYRCLVR